MTIEKLETAAAELTLPEDDVADWLGRVDAVIRKLSGLKRTTMAELDRPVSGSAYRVTESNSAKRSYNSARIITAFAEKGWTVPDLVNQDAVRLSWHWTGLKQAVRIADVDLHVAQHEVEDGDLDAPMVGEVWKSKYQIEGIGE